MWITHLSSLLSPLSCFLLPSWSLFLLTITFGFNEMDELHSLELCTHQHDKDRRSWNPGTLAHEECVLPRAGSTARGSRGFPWLPPLVQPLASHLPTLELHDRTSLAVGNIIHPLTTSDSLESSPKKMARGTRNFKRYFLSHWSFSELKTSMKWLISSQAMIWHIICLCLVLFEKKVIFLKTNCEKCQLKFASFCVRGQPWLEIKIQDHFWTHFDAINWMIILELTNELSLKITFFEVILLSRFAWYFNILIFGALFWKPSISLDSCWRVEFNFKIKSLCWLTDEKLIIWMILSLESEIWN